MAMSPKLLRPRRASAAAPAFSPTDLTGLYAWWDADDASTFTAGWSSPYISQWSDKSGNGHHLVQAIAADQPKRLANQMNGKTTVVFDVLQQYMDANPADWKFLHHGTDYYNIFCVLKPNQPSSSSRAWATTAGIYYGYEGFMGYLNREIDGGTTIDAAYGDYNSNAVSSALLLAANSDIELARAIVVSGRPSSSALRIRDNYGTLDDPFGSTGTSSGDPPYGFALGAEGQDIDGSMVPVGLYLGLFAEIIVYKASTDLSESQRNQVLDYLRTKWGLA